MAIFKPGQLVSLQDWQDDRVSLFDSPTQIDAKAIGWLDPGDVALLIHSRRNGSSVYVLGTHNGGWTFGALLKILRDVQ